MTYVLHHPQEVGFRLLQHLEIVTLSLFFACAIAARNARLRAALLGTFGVIYTLPSLAVFALLIPVFGLGLVTTVIALVAYAQMILVRSVAVGLQGVAPGMREAALGLGMTPLQALRLVELPQALPVIVGGLRLAAVATISIATLAGKIDAGGLGALLFAGLDNDDANRIFAGSAAAALLAIGADLALRGLERSVRVR
jgi:osmoprotectant transport system permease protein